jgi:glucan phosphoethanolaminetransferase (alkaline phosphatase superfamily)
MAMQLLTRLRIFERAVLICGPYVALAIWLLQTQRLPSVAGFLVAVAVTWMLIAAATRNWRRFLLWQFPLFLLSLAFAAYTLSYGSLPGYGLAYVLTTSSLEEFSGFFSIWAGEKLLLLTLLAAILYLWLAWRTPPVLIFARHPSARRWCALAGTAALGAFAALHADAMIDGVAADPLIGSTLFIAGPLHRVNVALAATAFPKVPYGATRITANEVHILIIGESARRDSWSAYGYERSTTPYLDSLKDEAILLRHAVADANLTVFAVPMLLTGMRPEEFDLSAVHGNLVDLAKEAGYSTSWLTNQDPGIGTLVGMAADRSVNSGHLAQAFGGTVRLDEALLPAFEQEIRRGNAPRFIVLHVMGSHWEYYRRYPPAFARFGLSETYRHVSPMALWHARSAVDAYDNSVLYSDWLLHQIIEQARTLRVPVTVTYISDHGEDLYTLDGIAGHGINQYTQHEFAIPAFVWTNATYQKVHPDRVAAIKANATKEIRSHDLFFSLAQIMGISWPGFRTVSSFASPAFVSDTHGKVIAGGTLMDAVSD